VRSPCDRGESPERRIPRYRQICNDACCPEQRVAITQKGIAFNRHQGRRNLSVAAAAHVAAAHVTAATHMPASAVSTESASMGCKPVYGWSV